MTTYLIVGLGNPGKKYELTRHNVGFLVADALAHALNAPAFKLKKRINALVTQLLIHDQLSVILVKPHTFMNLSGQSVAALVRSSLKTGKLKTDTLKNCLIISDDLDLPLGTIRLRERGGAGGHNGLKSIIEHLGTEEFPRLRIGIRPPGLERQPGKAEEFVLKRFTAEELKLIKEETIPKAVQEIIKRIHDKA